MSWTVPEIWTEGDCWVIGGGPSIIKQFQIPSDVEAEVRRGKKSLAAFSPFMECIHKKHIIGCNQAFRLGEWVDVMCFGDFKVFPDNREGLLKYPGIKVSFNSNFGKERFQKLGYDIKFLPRNTRKPKGLTRKRTMVTWNKNTGAAAINLAIHFGARRIFLLGFDMTTDREHQHFHNLYRNIALERDRQLRGKTPFGRHMQGFPQIAKDAKLLEVEIYNVNPDSAIKVFKKVTLEEALEL